MRRVGAIGLERRRGQWRNGRREVWLRRKHRGTSFHGQFLTGHGALRSFVKRIGMTEDDSCLFCNEVDTVEHGVLLCERWRDEKRRLDEDIGEELTAENVVGHMVESREKWQRVEVDYVVHVIGEKERVERKERG